MNLINQSARMMGLWMTSMVGMRKHMKASMAGMLDLGNWMGPAETKDLRDWRGPVETKELGGWTRPAGRKYIGQDQDLTPARWD